MSLPTNYEFKKRFEKEALELMEKIGYQLRLIDAMADELRFYSLFYDERDPNRFNGNWELFTNFWKNYNNYDMYRETIFNHLKKGAKVIKRSKRFIAALRELEGGGGE